MSNTNVYNMSESLTEDSVATAAAIDLIKSALSAGDSNRIAVLKWVCEEGNVKNMRDRIKESASGS
jgi:hypothetical protein